MGRFRVNDKMEGVNVAWSLHPESLLPQSAEELAALVKEVGAETCTVLVGDGKHTSIQEIYPGLPDFINALAGSGVECYSVQLDLSLEQLIGEPDFLKLLHACGVKEFSISELAKKGYFVRSRLTKSRTNLEKLQPLLEENELRLILPISGESLLPSPSAAFHLIRGLSPLRFGVQIDPGGTLFEGFEAWDYTVAILMDYLACITVRDNVLVRHPGAVDVNSKGWARRWSTVEAGMTDWVDMMRQLRNIEFAGRIELRPMVSETADEIKSEFAYLVGLLD